MEADICSCFALRWNSAESDGGKWATSVDNAFSTDRRLRGILIWWRLHTFLTLADVEPIDFAISLDELPSNTICRTRRRLSGVNRTRRLTLFVIAIFQFLRPSAPDVAEGNRAGNQRIARAFFFLTGNSLDDYQRYDQH